MHSIDVVLPSCGGSLECLQEGPHPAQTSGLLACSLTRVVPTRSVPTSAWHVLRILDLAA